MPSAKIEAWAELFIQRLPDIGSRIKSFFARGRYHVRTSVVFGDENVARGHLAVQVDEAQVWCIPGNVGKGRK